DRLNTGYKLLKKHQLQTTAELLELQDSLQKQLSEIENIDEELKQAKEESEQELKKVKELANQISKNRQQQIAPFTKNLHLLLRRVGMPNARIKMTMKTGSPSELGQDEVSLEFDANKSGTFLPIRKVASGGELS